MSKFRLEATYTSIEEIVRRSGTSFFWAMRGLPYKKRASMYAIYSFCRIVDDIADGQDDSYVKMSSLDRWRGEIDNLYGFNPTHIVTKELLKSVGLYGLKKQDFYDILDGMKMDVSEGIRIQNLKELEVYCDKVACAVGRLAVRVFGLQEKVGEELSFAQGQAMQLTNILRDIGEDLGQNRVYLPTDILQLHGIETCDNIEIGKHPKLPEVCKFLAHIAENRYVEARLTMKKCNRLEVRSARMMLELYYLVLSKLKKQGWVNISRRARLSKVEIIMSILRYGIF